VTDEDAEAGGGVDAGGAGAGAGAGDAGTVAGGGGSGVSEHATPRPATIVDTASQWAHTIRERSLSIP
jgi:hypothetical protein